MRKKTITVLFAVLLFISSAFCKESETAVVITWNDLMNNPSNYIGSTVEIHDTLYIISVNNWNKFGEVEISDERQMSPTDIALPGSIEYTTILNKNNNNRVILSDGSSTTYPNPRPWQDADGTCRTGQYTTLLDRKSVV